MQVLDWLAAWPGAVWLQGSGTAYLFVNAAHILGIGLLLGAILPLDLRLVGVLRSFPIAVVGPFLLRVASTGLALALLTGLWLFTVQPKDYVTNAAFLSKLVLLALALANIGLQHYGRHFRAALDGQAIHLSVRILAAVSAILWLSVLVAGRWIGFI
ncbi:DUF6644 family protein [Hyphomicrobium sp.]|uniref:DUF6644 family protein n=1 Tax=Hyphomicrobium sp. TaxID=82 RepID=UPI0025C0042B|nr:DUF6644 family protein [Hyphomicrobium sp.]MCC7253139.1 DUF2214 domain-containing protein [Hyphomicrobium sp.]